MVRHVSDSEIVINKESATNRKVLFRLMDNVDVRSLKGWMEYIAKDYREKGIVIDAVKLYDETQRKEVVGGAALSFNLLN